MTKADVRTGDVSVFGTMARHHHASSSFFSCAFPQFGDIVFEIAALFWYLHLTHCCVLSVFSLYTFEIYLSPRVTEIYFGEYRTNQS